MTLRKRRLKTSWLDAYRNYIVRQEAPEMFHIWVGMQMISAALRRNVYVDRGAYKLFPNQYVFLVAKSGTKKSTAIEIGLDLLENIDGIRKIHGRMSVEGLIDFMNAGSISPQTHRIVPDGSVLIHADELAYMFGKASYITDLMAFLTAAYTAKAKLDFLTRSRGICRVRNPCPSIITATTPEQMGEIFPSMTLASGFMGRVILVHGESTVRIAKPILDRSMEDILIHDLGCISELEGIMELTEEADEFFDSWYEAGAGTKKSITELAAFYERKHDHVLKTAMIISTSEGNDMKVDVDMLKLAIILIEKVERNIHRTLSYIGATIRGDNIDFAEKIIATVYPKWMNHSVLLRRMYRRLSAGASEFGEIIESLKDQGRVEDKTTRSGVFYKVIPKQKKT